MQTNAWLLIRIFSLKFSATFEKKNLFNILISFYSRDARVFSIIYYYPSEKQHAKVTLFNPRDLIVSR